MKEELFGKEHGDRIVKVNCGIMLVSAVFWLGYGIATGQISLRPDESRCFERVHVAKILMNREIPCPTK